MLVQCSSRSNSCGIKCMHYVPHEVQTIMLEYGGIECTDESNCYYAQKKVKCVEVEEERR